MPDNHPIWRNTVALQHVANLAKASFDEVRDVTASLRIKTLNGRVTKQEGRAILSKLLIRERDPLRKDQVRRAVYALADDPDDPNAPS